MTAPERIWAAPFGSDAHNGSWVSMKSQAYLGGSTAYIRSDIHQQALDRIAELEGALGLRKIHEWEWEHYKHKTTDHNDTSNNIPYLINGWKCGPYTILRQLDPDGLFLLRTPDGKGQIASPYKSVVIQAAKDHNATLSKGDAEKG